MLSWRHAVSLLAVLLPVANGAQAEDPLDRSGLAWERGADRVLAAAAEGPEALARAVRTPGVDPWILVDALVGRQEWEAAGAVAAAWTGPRFGRLHAYLEEQRRQPLDPAIRDARDLAASNARRGDAAGALAAIQTAPDGRAGVPGAWIEYLHATLLATGGRVPEAVAAYDRSADLAEGIGWSEQLHAALRDGGATAFRAGLREEALRLHRRQLPVAEQVASPEDLAGCVINVGSLCAQLRRWDEAVAWLRRGLDLTLPSVGGDAQRIRSYRLNALVALGQVHVLREEYAHAVGILEEAPALATSLRRETERGITLLFLGRARLHLELVEEGAESYAEAARVFEGLGDAAKRREALQGRAACLLDLGRLEEALAVHEEIAALAGPDTTVDERVAAEGERALALQAAERYEEAEAVYEAALALARSTGSPLSVNWVRLNHATMLCERGRYAEAREPLEAALAAAAGNAYLERHARQWLAGIALAEGHPDLARAHVDRGIERSVGLLSGLSDVEAARARTALGMLLQVGLHAALAEGDAAGAMRYAETGRGLGFLEMLGARTPEAAAAIPPDLKIAADAENERVGRARTQVARARAAGDLQAARAAKAELDDALEAFQVARRKIERFSKLAAEAAYPQAADPQALAGMLAQDEALVVYEGVGPDAVAFVLRSDGVTRSVRLGEAAPIVPVLAQFLDALRDPGTPVDPAPLRERLVTPLALGPDVRRVLVSPYGRLNELPFAVLLPEREVAYAPSGTVLLGLGRPEPAIDAGVLALGDPDYTGALGRTSAAGSRGRLLAALPATAVEVRRIASAARDVALLAGEATEEGLRLALGSRPRWHAIHFACHGLLDSERPALSSLALTPGSVDDGYLTALEVTSLPVAADLVVLSACETSRGSLQHCEGIVGLTRSFMLAGAPRVVCSLWPVDDAATHALMTRFYELWNPPVESGRSPLPPAAALREAQTFVRDHPEHPRWRHPYYWAAWVLWGLPQ